MAAAKADARRVNPDIEIIETSCVSAPGLQGWLDWVERATEASQLGCRGGDALKTGSRVKA